MHHDAVLRRGQALYETKLAGVQRAHDRLFGWLLLGQWAFAILVALLWSPVGWSGKTRAVHAHVWIAALGGLAINALPLLLVWWRAGWGGTRQAVAIAQMLWSAVLVHLSGGRIETHFHVFVSLAFLAFYRDWRVLATATVVVATDHVARGLLWPESVYGIANPEWWRFIEHASWVVFENVVLGLACVRGVRELHLIAHREAELELSNERTEAEVRARTAELQASLTRFRSLIENTDAVAWELDAATHTFSYIAPQAVEHLGQPLEHLRSPGGFLALVHPEDRARVAAAVAATGRAATGACDAHLDYRIVTRSGDVRDVRSILHRRRGEDLTIQGITLDVTTTRKLELQLRQSQKLEAVGRLAAGVAHDFNNLLTAILGYSQMVEGALPDGSAARADLREVRRGAERAAELTHQLLAFSRRQVLQPRLVDLEGAVRAMEPLLRRVLGEDIHLQIRSGAAPCRVLTDPGQLEQVILNLAVNARDAMPRGGDLLLETSAGVEPPPGADDAPPTAPTHWAMLMVRDTGTGMDAETLAHLFEPFFTTKGVGRGTGLGLSMVHGFVAQSHGQVTVESAPGAGTTFRVYLPAAIGASPAPVAPAPAAPRGGHETLLIVEDEAPLRDLMTRVLREGGYRVLIADGPAQALAIAGETRLDLLVSDVILPASSGPEISACLSTVQPDLPVLYISGYTDDALGRQGVLAPGTDLLPKPFAPAALALRVRQALDRAAAPRLAARV